MKNLLFLKFNNFKFLNLQLNLVYDKQIYAIYKNKIRKYGIIKHIEVKYVSGNKAKNRQIYFSYTILRISLA